MSVVGANLEASSVFTQPENHSFIEFAGLLRYFHLQGNLEIVCEQIITS